VITDDQLIERLRGSMSSAAADVSPAPGLLEGISPGRKGFRLPGLAGFAVAFAAVVAVVVAVVAVSLLRHTSASHSVVPAIRVAPGPTSLGELRSELAILQQPQRAADKMPAWGIAAEERVNCSNCLNVARLIPSETRLLAKIHLPHSDAEFGPGPERVYLVIGTIPTTWGNGGMSGWRQLGRAVHGVHLSLVGLTSNRSHHAQPVDELLNYRNHSSMPTQALTPRDVMITTVATIGVVPDGVTRVKWELANPGQAHAVAIYPRVQDNVAIAPWTPAPRYTALMNEQRLIGATWYGADGRVIASFRDDLAKLDQ